MSGPGLGFLVVLVAMAIVAAVVAIAFLPQLLTIWRALHG